MVEQHKAYGGRLHGESILLHKRCKQKMLLMGALEKSITRCCQNNTKRGILAVIAISNVCHNLMRSGIKQTEMDLKT